MKKIIFLITLLTFGMGIWSYWKFSGEKINVSRDVIVAPDISAADAILIDGKDGNILYARRENEKGYPASTTKILTGLVALEICEEYGIPLDTKVKIPNRAVGVEGSSLYLKKGESKTLKELLYGTMLRSGNDSATALAMILGGTLKNFVKRMNERAQQLGCKCSNFVNPTGLHDDNHYTTAFDLAIIAREAMKNYEFRKIVAAKSWKNYTNKNKTVFQYEGGNGIKIGYTEVAGRTLVASARRGDVQLIAVVLSDGNWFMDAYRLLDYGFKIEESR